MWEGWLTYRQTCVCLCSANYCLCSELRDAMSCWDSSPVKDLSVAPSNRKKKKKKIKQKSNGDVKICGAPGTTNQQQTLDYRIYCSFRRLSVYCPLKFNKYMEHKIRGVLFTQNSCIFMCSCPVISNSLAAGRCILSVWIVGVVANWNKFIKLGLKFKK